MANRQQRRRDAQRASSRRVQQNKPQNSGGGSDWRRYWPLLAAIGAVAVIGIVIIVLLVGGGDDDDGGEDELLGALDPAVARDGNLLGDPNAPIQMIEFLDYQCPNCKNYVDNTEPLIVEEFVKTGQVSIEVRNFAFLGPESVGAANAALCAQDQDLFFEYKAILFDEQTGENVGDFEQDNLKDFAGRIEGMDTDRFDQCVDAQQFNSTVNEDIAMARSVGITGTPGFLVNGNPITGDQGIEGWRLIFEQLLATPEAGETETLPTTEGGSVTPADTPTPGGETETATAEPTDTATATETATATAEE